MRNRNKVLAQACLLFILPLLLPAPSVGGDPEFHSLVEHVSAYYQKRPMRFMGLLDFVANRFPLHGVSHLKMAIFEDVNSSRLPPGQDFESILQGLVGATYQPFVRVYDNHSGEQSFIYARERNTMTYEMLIVSMERTTAVVIKMRLDAETMGDWVDEPINRSHDSARGGRTGVARQAQHERPSD